MLSPSKPCAWASAAILLTIFCRAAASCQFAIKEFYKIATFTFMNQLVKIKNELRKMKPELVERFHVNSIGLFGSVVRDDFTDKSDIDIIVDFTKPIGIAFIDLADLLETALKR